MDERVKASQARSCAGCRHWTRHHPRDAGGHCAWHLNDFAFEDDICDHFTPSGCGPIGETDT